MANNTEPVITVGAITTAVGAIIAAAVSFGLPITDQQQADVMGALAAALPLVVALVARRYVSPVAATIEDVDGYSDPEAEATDADRTQTHRADV